jgi:hydrogenase maturation factor
MHKECEKIGVTAMHDATECSVWGGAAFDTATSQGA